jgi:H+/gluconate symporter-like permease
MYWQAVGVLVVFVVFAVLMMTRRLPALLALPAMAAAIALVGGMGVMDMLGTVIGEGAMRLATPIAAVIFGGALAQVVRRTGVAESIVKRAAELSGDNAVTVSLVVAAACVVLFMTLSGLGAVILVASLAFPVLLAVGVRPLAAGSLFLIAMSVGGVLNVVNWQFYIDALGVTQAQVRQYALVLFVPSLLAVLAYVMIDVRLAGRRHMWAEDRRPPAPAVSPVRLATPIIPVLLILLPPVSRPLLNLVAPSLGYEPGTEAHEALLGWEFPIVAAMVLGVLWGALLGPRPEGGRIQLITASLLEGIKDVAPAVGLMMGIGMLFMAVSSPEVKECLVTQDPATGEMTGPLTLLRVSSPVAYVLLWGAMAPLALYRGPLNVWGMGIGIAGVLVAGGVLPAGAAMAALMSVGHVQGVSDPTNTHNVWVGATLGVEVQDLLKRTLPYSWILAVVGLAIAVPWFLS